MSGARFLALMRERWWHIPALALGLMAVDFLRVFQVVAATPGVSHVAVAFEELSHWLLRCAGLVVVLTVCDSLAWPRVPAAMARIAGVAVCAWAMSNGLEVAIFGDAQVKQMGLMSAGFAYYVAWLQLAAGALLAWYYAAHGRALETANTLIQAERARAEAMRQVLESRLEIMKARIDPEFLLDSLSLVQALYESNSAAADGALDDLIDNLRTAFQGRVAS